MIFFTVAERLKKNGHSFVENAFLSISSQTEINGSSCICRALPERSSESRPQKQAAWQTHKRQPEIVADNRRQYFIKADDRNWGPRCADNLPKRQNERSLVHHLIRGEAARLFAIRSPGWAGRKSVRHFRLEDAASLWLWADSEPQMSMLTEQRKRKCCINMCPGSINSSAQFTRELQALRFWCACACERKHGTEDTEVSRPREVTHGCCGPFHFSVIRAQCNKL